MQTPPPLLFLTGATASGKTAVALEVARRLDAEIVNADAYQIYRQIPLLTASPSPEELQHIPHHLVSFLDVTENWDAALHYAKATEAIKAINARGKTALVVGGSGLYVKFLSHGMSEAPSPNPELRAKWDKLPLEILVEQLSQLDPEGAANTNLTNRRYVTRNLEIVFLSGKPLSWWRQNWQREPAGPGFSIHWETDELDARIRQRSEQLLTLGAVEEVRALSSFMPLSTTAAKTLGLSQIQDYLDGKLTHKECLDLLILRTRQYAKRQRTWLRRESWLTPLERSSSATIFSFAEKLLSCL